MWRADSLEKTLMLGEIEGRKRRGRQRMRRLEMASLLLWVSWTARRSNQSILKEINPEYSLEGLMLKLKLQYFGHLMWKADLLAKALMLRKIKGGRRGWQRMRWLDRITNSMDMSFEQALGDGEGQGSLVCCSPCGHKVLDTTKQLNWVELKLLLTRIVACRLSHQMV